MTDRDEESGQTEPGSTSAPPWSVHGVDAGTREIAAAAARSGNLPVGDWVDRAILRATRQDPTVFAEGSADAAAEDDPTGLVRSFAELDARHAAAEARLSERLHALHKDIEGLARGIGGLGRGTVGDRPAPVPRRGDVGSPSQDRPRRSRRRWFAAASVLVLFGAALGGGGWALLALTEPPKATKPALAPPVRQNETAAREPPPPAISPATPKTPAEQETDRLEAAARGGDAKAQHDLAIRLAQGEGGAPDYAAAARWFTAAALQGLPNAQYNLGVLYEKGLGVEKSDRDAWVWYRNAAEAGHGQAQYNLGVAYAEGRGMPRDDTEAIRWFRGAAQQGVAEAHFNLARLLEAGRGTARDLEAARRHYVEAAAGGVTAARDRLAELRSSEKSGGAAENPPPALDRAAIVEIQTLLAALDFDPGPADGNFGPRARDATRLFQQFAGLPETGEPSRALLDELRAVSGLSAR